MQQRFIKLTTETSVYTNTKPIEKYLATTEFDWLLNCELDNVVLEIKDNILYFKEGTIYWGNWRWGVFEKGEFRSGTWQGGIVLGGTVKAKWLNGVDKTKQLNQHEKV